MTTVAGSRPDPATYMAAVAATPAGASYKARVLEAMDLQPGHVVIDLGCGPGTDLAALAAQVGPSGR